MKAHRHLHLTVIVAVNLSMLAVFVFKSDGAVGHALIRSATAGLGWQNAITTVLSLAENAVALCFAGCVPAGDFFDGPATTHTNILMVEAAMTYTGGFSFAFHCCSIVGFAAEKGKIRHAG